MWFYLNLSAHFVFCTIVTHGSHRWWVDKHLCLGMGCMYQLVFDQMIPKDVERFRPFVYYDFTSGEWVVEIYPDTRLSCFGCDYSGGPIHRHFKGQGLGQCDKVKAFYKLPAKKHLLSRMK